MSMYAEYLTEKTDDQILEVQEGFATYRYIDEKTVYIIDIYVKPEFRRNHIAKAMADTIVRLAKEKGCQILLGSVVPSAKGSTESLKALIAYGFQLHSSQQNFVVFKKEI